MISLYYRRAVAVIAVLCFFTNLSTYLFLSETAAIPGLYWIVGLGLLTLPLCVTREFLRNLRQSPIVRWCYGFLLVSGVWFLFQSQQVTEDSWHELQGRGLSVLYILIILCICSTEDGQLSMRRAILAVVLLAIGLNIYEMFSPSVFSSVYGRSAGLYINPNMAGMALILGMILSIGLLPQRYRLFFVLLAGAGVFMTLSRGAIIGWAVSLLLLLKTGEVQLKRSFVGSLAAVAIILIVLVPWMDDLTSSSILSSNSVDRLAWFKSPDALDHAASDRKEVLKVAVEKLGESPFMGNGVGASLKLLEVEGGVEISSHNQYIKMMVDHGVLGVFIPLLMILAATCGAKDEARRISATFASYLIVLGFFTHMIFESRFILMSFSLMAAMTMTSRWNQRARGQGLPDS
jgi:O-Antigen ligase